MFNIIIQKFQALTEQENWIVKILIGGVLLYIPIIGHVFVLGYLMQVLENTKQNQDLVLPEWVNFERLFLDGLPIMIFCYGIILLNVLITSLVQFLPFIGPLVALVLNISVSFIIPSLLTIYIFRVKELQNWIDALNVNAIIEDFQKGLKDYLPVLVFQWLFTLIALLVGCCGFLSPFPYFGLMLVFYPMLGAVYMKNAN